MYANNYFKHEWIKVSNQKTQSDCEQRKKRFNYMLLKGDSR